MRRLGAILSATLLILSVTSAYAGEGRARRETRSAVRPKLGTLDVGQLQIGTLRLGVLLADRSLDEPLPLQATAAAGKDNGKKVKEASCQVIEFHASKTGAPKVDDKLGKWKAELNQPPLSAFDSFKVTGEKTVVIAPGSTSSVKITANLTLLFKGVVTENSKDRLQLEVTVDNATGKRMYRSTTTQDSGASQILSAGKSGDANVFFVATCTAK